MTGVDTYHVVALGSPGSGKTVYLSALHHVLGNDPDAVGRGITATVEEPDKRALLAKTYDLAVEPEDPSWPAGTHSGEQMREFVFAMKVSWTQKSMRGTLKRRTFHPLNVSYVDYAGEWIPEAYEQSAEVLEPFKKRVREAHALLGIIDGLRLLQFMQGHRSTSFMNDQVRPIVAFMEGTDVPLHFIITKWDLLDSRGITLDAVRTKMLESGGAGFGKLVESRTAQAVFTRRPQGSIRFIPVTSLGGLAVLQDDWTITKNAAARASQQYVEVPLLATVYDICDLAARRLRAGQAGDAAGSEAADAAGVDVQRVGQFAQRQLDGQHGLNAKIGLTGISISLSQIVAFMADNGQGAVRLLGKPAMKTGRTMRRGVRRVKARDLKGVRSPEAALYYVMRTLRHKLQAFEAEQPSSMLDA
ncbi:hypothetical protein Caci_3745 [Catenulispora acidiphila DSM 44928]|uniref:Uncharacterized protein n=1 Tax=Catenulispora acidiphila (strain DSM 44928 / JCM 14897 / NBRC 102108 / NRRL B-24433 / ID139908) TaxID=479433 RepID=C7QC28_CATAD|nr:hypothetical protein [Catenulispora acidiphila]ACU72647.1 hypothetical protein Caci_3745 [Catenulispora acidiphila DSM 44928]